MRPKQDIADSYFCLARYLTKCMMRVDALNLRVYPVKTKMTTMKQIPISSVFSTDKSELKYSLVNETLSQICSTDEDESKGIIVDKCST